MMRRVKTTCTSIILLLQSRMCSCFLNGILVCTLERQSQENTNVRRVPSSSANSASGPAWLSKPLCPVHRLGPGAPTPHADAHAGDFCVKVFPPWRLSGEALSTFGCGCGLGFGLACPFHFGLGWGCGLVCWLWLDVN